MGSPASKPQSQEMPALNWVSQFFCHAPVHNLGHFLDIHEFAALQATSSVLRNSLRNVVRTRNAQLLDRRMANLEDLIMCAQVKELQKRELQVSIEQRKLELKRATQNIDMAERKLGELRKQVRYASC